jgi:hypothetical protein
MHSPAFIHDMGIPGQNVFGQIFEMLGVVFRVLFSFREQKEGMAIECVRASMISLRQ